MTLLALSAAWLAGIVLARAADFPWWGWLVMAAPAAAGLLLVRKRHGWRLAFACALALVLGAVRYCLSLPRLDASTLASYNDQGFVTLSGVIDDMPDERDTHVNLRVRVDSLTPEDGPQREVQGTALVQAPRGERYHYGDRVEVRGKLETPPVLEGFSYRDYLAREGISSMVRYARVEPTASWEGNRLRAAMIAFRERAHSAITALLPDPQAALLSGILLGIESRISPEVREAFNAVGATHVIAISGSNLVILAGIIQALAARVVKRPGAVATITIVGIVAYAAFVGGDAAVVRATIMTSLALVAAQLGRQTYGLASLGFAAILMSAINPLVLWDVGFQLSFLATLGLVLYVEPLQGVLEKGLGRILSQQRAQQVVAALSDAFIVTLAAQITTTPIIALTFGRLSVLSLPVNLLIIPAQTPLMVLGGLGVLAALVWWPLGQIIAWGSWLFLTWTAGVVRLAARLPYASLELRDVPPLAVWGIYGVMFGLTFAAMQQPGALQNHLTGLRRALGTKALAAGGLGMAALLFATAWSLPDGRLHVTFVDTGGAAATLIETPGGRQILVDAGGSGRRLRTALGDALPFWDRRLDLLVITEPAASNVAALPDVLSRYRFDAVMIPAGAAPPAVGSAQVIAAQPGMTVRVGDGVLLTVLDAPAAPPPGVEPSAEPVVLLVEYGDARVLLPGDLTPEGEARLLSAGTPLHAAVMQVPRGGHESVCGEAFLAATSPQIAVIAVEEGNRSGLPHEPVLERLSAAGAVIYRTDEDGTVRITTDGRGLWIRTGR